MEDRKEKKKIIYMDNAGTTKPTERAICSVDRIMREYWYNPSTTSFMGEQTRKILEDSRKKIIRLIGGDEENDNLYFVASGSMANELAINHIEYVDSDDYPYMGHSLLVDPLSHHSVTETCNSGRTSVQWLKCDGDGFIDIEDLDEKCSEFVGGYIPLVAITGGNNEIGTVQDIRGISDVVHRHNGVLFVDAIQLYPDRSINVRDMNIDMMSISGHKIGCPSGIAALYVRNGITLSPIVHGTQEKGIVGGTENVAFAYAFAECCEELEKHRDDVKITAGMRNLLWTDISDNFSNASLVGSDGKDIEYGFSNRLSNNLSVMFKGTDAKDLIMYLENHDIYVSGGSACNSRTYEPSTVLKGIGIEEPDVFSVVRFTVNKDILITDILDVIDAIRDFYVVKKIERINISNNKGE